MLPKKKKNDDDDEDEIEFYFFIFKYSRTSTYTIHNSHSWLLSPFVRKTKKKLKEIIQILRQKILFLNRKEINFEISIVEMIV